MEFKYTINDIKAVVKVSLQSLYTLIKKNQAFINDNSIRKQRKIYYNQAVMDFFISYYHPSDIPNSKENPYNANLEEVRAPEGEQKSPVKGQQAEEPTEYQLDLLQRKIEALEAEIGTLRKQLNASEEERKELIRQNGAILLVLQQEKQEKQLFLPSPRKTLSEKVKSLFHKG